MWPQIVLIVLSTAGLTLALSKDKTALDRSASVIASGITHGLLYAGGFYDVFWR